MTVKRAFIWITGPFSEAVCFFIACAGSAAASMAKPVAANPAAPTPGADQPAPMTDIHDIKPALAFDTPWPWWVWLTLVLILAGVIALAWWLKRRRDQTETEVSDTPALPPEVEAFQRLDALAAGERSDPKRFYFSLSGVLRHYVERRFDFPAAEMTTEELLPRIRKLSMANNLVQAFKDFCLSSDPVKFADAVADQARMRQDMAFARQFVEQTTAAVEPAVVEEPNNTALATLKNNP